MKTRFLCALVALSISGWMHGESPEPETASKPATQPEHEETGDELIQSFESSGDLNLLTKVAARLANPDNNPALSTPEKTAALYVRALGAIHTWENRGVAGWSGYARQVEAFQKEMRERTDLPRINPGVTQPEDIPDVRYRKRYVAYLKDLKELENLGKVLPVLTNFEINFRLRVEPQLQQLTREQQKRVLNPARVAKLSPQVKIDLGSALNLTLEVNKNGHVFYVGHTRDEMKETGMAPYLNFRIVKPFACQQGQQAYAVLVRDDRCYVLDDTRHERETGTLPVHAGDQFFGFKGLDDLKSLGIPVLRGVEATTELLKQEKR